MKKIILHLILFILFISCQQKEIYECIQVVTENDLYKVIKGTKCMIWNYNPEKLNKLKNIDEVEELHLCFYNYNNIPRDSCEFKKLKSLYIVDSSLNKISQILSFFKFNQNISHLELGLDSIFELPKEISYYKNLEVLAISFRTDSVVVPPEVMDMRSLKYLVILGKTPSPFLREYFNKIFPNLKIEFYPE